jgi:hypothetical protein
MHALNYSYFFGQSKKEQVQPHDSGCDTDGSELHEKDPCPICINQRSLWVTQKEKATQWAAFSF